MATKWGILSASKISNDFVLALETLSAEDHKVVAIAAKDKLRAQDFAHDHKIPTYYGSYDELGNDSDVGRYKLYILGTIKLIVIFYYYFVLL